MKIEPARDVAPQYWAAETNHIPERSAPAALVALLESVKPQ